MSVGIATEETEKHAAEISGRSAWTTRRSPRRLLCAPPDQALTLGEVLEHVEKRIRLLVGGAVGHRAFEKLDRLWRG